MYNDNYIEEMTTCSLCGDYTSDNIFTLRGAEGNICITCDMDLFLHGDDIKHKIGRDYCHHCYSDIRLPPADSVRQDEYSNRVYHSHCHKMYKSNINSSNISAT